jgi:hypothetical protein
VLAPAHTFALFPHGSVCTVDTDRKEIKRLGVQIDTWLYFIMEVKREAEKWRGKGESARLRGIVCCPRSGCAGYWYLLDIFWIEVSPDRSHGNSVGESTYSTELVASPSLPGRSRATTSTYLDSSSVRTPALKSRYTE